MGGSSSSYAFIEGGGNVERIAIDKPGHQPQLRERGHVNRSAPALEYTGKPSTDCPLAP